VSESLTNTTKHARVSLAHVTVEERDALLHLSIRDHRQHRQFAARRY